MTIARVPSTYTSSVPLASPFKSVRQEEHIYTLSDEWFIREDVVAHRYQIEHVLVSNRGVFALFSQKRSGVLQQNADQFFVGGERQDHAIQQAWHVSQALETLVGTRVYPVLVYRELSSPDTGSVSNVGRRGYTAEAAEAPVQSHWKIQGTLVTSWEHLPQALEKVWSKVFQWKDVCLLARKVRLLNR